jgi:hypothetical protein
VLRTVWAATLDFYHSSKSAGASSALTWPNLC